MWLAMSPEMLFIGGNRRSIRSAVGTLINQGRLFHDASFFDHHGVIAVSKVGSGPAHYPGG
jgi:hypothetical protein